MDPTRVFRLLRTLTDEVALLEREASASVERRSDPLWLRGVKFSFVVAVEAALKPQLAQRMTQAVGFRNVLVHDYTRVDDDVVVRRLGDLSDLTGFAAAVSRAVPAQA